MNPTQKIDRPWSEYPIGTKAFASGGGHWTKTVRGWQWCSGATFGTPGGDAYCVQLPTTVYCHACSVAGGADRGIYHTAPACH